MGDLVDSNTNAQKKGSGLIVEDFSSFCEGDKEPTLNKMINHLIDTEADYIVYIDEDYFIEWSLTDNYEKSDAYNELKEKGLILPQKCRHTHAAFFSQLSS